ncbi:glycosyltransferase family 4 protein [Pyxidicoccus fallax]|uniref:Glycosyltransferase family 4 protein n=1 Tax=Pyxidicoccus fallax TaxID=394095 RepID=A0A848LCH9_9BACT|nr:glycosyltransferase family 4 protein [Pyxidicoccus fallax]NMO15942.1 glycosyltransferase family 4 protein [Pyxidicoccus fallax]NPC81964.1 glycosyltransferase family 4 protein [Pyxidicoccus fallax]
MTADTVGGVWTYALELTRALASHGVEVTLATMGAPLSEARWAEARALPNLAVEESRFALEWMDDPWDDVRAAGDWLLSLEARLRPDVVHLNGYAHGALPWARPPLVVGHSCVLSWWRAVKGEDAPDRYARYHDAVAAGLRAAGRVVAPSAAMLEALREHYGPLPASDVIFNARGFEAFPSGSAREPFILSAGRLWDEAKNVSLLAAVAPRLSWPVMVAGDARHPAGWRVESPNVEMLGLLAPSVLARWMARAAVYALPARYEPFGLSALEAALSGCALVLGDIPSLREVWGDGAALFVPPSDGDALVEALESLSRDTSLRTRLAERARERALNYTPRRMAAAYLSVYAELRHPHPESPTP